MPTPGTVSALSNDESQQYDKAIPELQEAIRLKPDYADAWYDLGVVYNALRQYGKAISAYQQAIRLKPDYAEAWYGLGLVYYGQGNRSEVMRVYEKLKTLDHSLADKLFQTAGSLPVAGGQQIQDWGTTEDLKRSIRDGLVWNSDQTMPLISSTKRWQAKSAMHSSSSLLARTRANS